MNTAYQNRARRVNPKERLVVVNDITAQDLGQVVNLSTSGMMLAARFDFNEKQIFQAKLTVGEQALSIGLECVWAETQLSGMTYGGFTIIDISDSDLQYLQTYIDSHSAEFSAK